MNSHDVGQDCFASHIIVQDWWNELLHRISSHYCHHLLCWHLYDSGWKWGSLDDCSKWHLFFLIFPYFIFINLSINNWFKPAYFNFQQHHSEFVSPKALLLPERSNRSFNCFGWEKIIKKRSWRRIPFISAPFFFIQM